jgi:cell division septum initiation protein DivIVA
MKERDQKSINNLMLRYQDYDNAGTTYAFDVSYATIHNDGVQIKAKRQVGAEAFRTHIDELVNRYDGVSTIYVEDFAGRSRNSKPLNPPVEIQLLDIVDVRSTPRLIKAESKTPPPAAAAPQTELIRGLAGFFAGSEYEALGSIAPIAKFIDDKHQMARLNEKNTEQAERIAKLEDELRQLKTQHESLNKQYGQLEDARDELQDEVEDYRARENRKDALFSTLGNIGANVAKTFLQKNPKLLSAIIPQEQLAGLWDAEADAPKPPQDSLTPEQRQQLDDASVIFEWLQNLPAELFEQVAAIFSVMRDNADYIPHLVRAIRMAPPQTVHPQ